MAQMVKRAYKYRFYPTPEQASELARTFGRVRYVYNKALAERSRAYAQEGRKVSYAETSAMLTGWKRAQGLELLSQVSCVPLQQALRHPQAAFAGFFAKRSKHPVFKSRKRSRASAEYTRSAFRRRDGELLLAKMDAPLDIVWSRPLPAGAQPSTVTVSRDAAGRWWVSILVEETIRPLDPVEACVGVDAGITSLVTLSTGEKIANPGHGRADRRRDFLHKFSTRLVRDDQTVVIEDLAVRNMVKNRSLARAISDASWRELRAMLEYKPGWYGRRLVVVDRWFPSSKLCSACGALRQSMPLRVREWACACGVIHDRDVNAATNLLAAGLAER
ncbi:RNA-guided endonuclease InsQ/TnpB family protein [Sphaerisporangium dianthi]|uniref:RNA-guided endonuclease InsQ/TnpB family protein n=1 Tax=Sphaerisporangium dianthi TaxID=1436120 RepID=A0ABV9CG70_9ACTN